MKIISATGLSSILRSLKFEGLRVVIAENVKFHACTITPSHTRWNVSPDSSGRLTPSEHYRNSMLTFGCERNDDISSHWAVLHSHGQRWCHLLILFTVSIFPSWESLAFSALARGICLFIGSISKTQSAVTDCLEVPY